MNYVAIGVIAVVLVVLVLVALDRWGVFQDDDENQNSGTARVEREARQEEVGSLSVFERHKSLTLPGKVVALSTGLLVLSAGVYGYYTLKNGAPVEVPYVRSIQAGGVGIVGLLAGVGLANAKTRSRGRLEVVFEGDDARETDTEVVWFDPSESETDSNGRTVIYEHFSTRILGLFGRRKLVGHDRELRSRRNVLGDLVAHRIPDHAVRVSDDHYLVRTQGRKVVSGPSSAADYEYRSPIELSYEKYLQQREANRKMQMRIDSMSAQLGEAQSQLRDFRRRLETREYRSREEAREEIKEIIEMLPARNNSYQVERRDGEERKPQSQRELSALENGEAEA